MTCTRTKSTLSHQRQLTRETHTGLFERSCRMRCDNDGRQIGFLSLASTVLFSQNVSQCQRRRSFFWLMPCLLGRQLINAAHPQDVSFSLSLRLRDEPSGNTSNPFNFPHKKHAGKGLRLRRRRLLMKNNGQEIDYTISFSLPHTHARIQQATQQRWEVLISSHYLIILDSGSAQLARLEKPATTTKNVRYLVV